jgi:hypothetical protein
MEIPAMCKGAWRKCSLKVARKRLIAVGAVFALSRGSLRRLFRRAGLFWRSNADANHAGDDCVCGIA